MLPSGNDAALALAKWAGAQIKVDKEDKEDKEEVLPYNAFLSTMNKEAKKIGLRNSIFVNSNQAKTFRCERVAKYFGNLCRPPCGISG